MTLHLGRFAGYVWHGDVSAISGSWAVPRLTSGGGISATWIGAEAPGRPGPFIQIGTNEQRLTATGAPEYFAFWSDRAHRFLAQTLFYVRAGDRIRAELHLMRLHWRLSLVDETAQIRTTFKTATESRATLTEGEWLQENVARGRTANRRVYPRLSPTTFRRIGVNNHPPSYGALRSLWMSLDGTSLAPSALASGGFTIRPTVISAAGTRYLMIAQRLNTVIGKLAAQTLRASPAPARRQVATAFATLVAALRANVHELRDTHWPEDARSAIDALARDTEAVLSSLVSAEANPRLSELEEILGRANFDRLGLSIRRILRLPEDVAE